MNQNIQILTQDQMLAVISQLQTLINKVWIQSEQRRVIDDIQRGLNMLLNSIQLEMQREDAEQAKKELETPSPNGALEQNLAN